MDLDQNGIDALIHDVSEQAVAWYTVFTGKPAPVAAQSPPIAPVAPAPASVSASLAAADYSTLVSVAVIVVVAVLLLKS